MKYFKELNERGVMRNVLFYVFDRNFLWPKPILCILENSKLKIFGVPKEMKQDFCDKLVFHAKTEHFSDCKFIMCYPDFMQKAVKQKVLTNVKPGYVFLPDTLAPKGINYLWLTDKGILRSLVFYGFSYLAYPITIPDYNALLCHCELLMPPRPYKTFTTEMKRYANGCTRRTDALCTGHDTTT